MSSKRPPLDEFALERLSSIDTDGLISRRELMTRASIFGAAATLATFSGVLGAAGQTAGGKVTVGLDSGAFTPILKTFAPEFKKATGLEVDFQSYPLGNMYDQNMLALRQTQARFDAFDFWPNFVGDFGPYLTPFEEVGKLEDLGFADVAPPFQLLNIFEGKTVGIMIDGDMFINTYRSDLFEDAAETKAFKAKYGYDLGPATDYKQYRDIGEFFTRPDKKSYGLVEVTSFFVYAFFINQFVQLGAEKGGRYGELFDADMKPQLSTDIGVEALQRLHRDHQVHAGGPCQGDALGRRPAGILRGPRRAGQLVDRHAQGRVRSGDVQGGRQDQGRPELGWRDAPALRPGHRHRQELRQQGGRLQGHRLAANRPSRADAWVAETFAQSLMDPWRMSMFNDPKATFPLQAQSGFADNFASVCKGQLSNKKTYLDISIPGTNRYLASMIQHVQQAITGQQTPKEALDAMTAEFEDATDTYDRDRQIKHNDEYRQRMIKAGYWT